MKKLIPFLFFIGFLSCKAPIEQPISPVASTESSAVTKQPNIILILGDDIGYEIPTADGGSSYQTPNLDSLAAQGVKFTQAHACPLCSPSRFAIMTGKYNFRNYTQWGDMPQDTKTFANMLHDAGYATGVFGKWQLNGAAASASAFGFDQYVLFNPTQKKNDTAEVGGGSRYKNPVIYAGRGGIGDYLPDSQLQGKYGPDVFNDSVISFITSSVSSNKPFFAYVPTVSCHLPFQPTPDDSDYAAFDETHNHSDKKYYPSMVKYMDKLIGKIVHTVDSLGIGNNTIIMFIGDNGTPGLITSILNGQPYKGGKGTTLEAGTHVPLIVRWTGHAPIHADSSLVGLIDFLPTLANIANVIVPDYGVLDGVDFYPQIKGNRGHPRDWLFTHFQKSPDLNSPLYRWIQNTKYKEYDSTFLLYNIARNENEKLPITPANAEQKKIDSLFRAVLDSLK